MLLKIPGSPDAEYQPMPKPSPFVGSAPMRELRLCSISECCGPYRTLSIRIGFCRNTRASGTWRESCTRADAYRGAQPTPAGVRARTLPTRGCEHDPRVTEPGERTTWTFPEGSVGHDDSVKGYEVEATDGPVGTCSWASYKPGESYLVVSYGARPQRGAPRRPRGRGEARRSRAPDRAC